MAAARPPTYRGGYLRPNRKIPKPRRRAAAIGVRRATGQPLAKKPAAPKPPRPAAPATPPPRPMPTAPTPVAVPQQAITPIRPPQTLQSASDRLGVNANFGNAITDINTNLMTAARKYGGMPNVIQYDNAGNPVSTALGAEDPNSALATIGRNQTTQEEYLRNKNNVENNFFSGFHQKQQADQLSDTDRQRAAAYQEFLDSQAQLQQLLLESRTERETGLRNADIADWEAAAAREPEPGQAAPPAPVPRGRAPARAKPPRPSARVLAAAAPKPRPGNWWAIARYWENVNKKYGQAKR